MRIAKNILYAVLCISTFCHAASDASDQPAAPLQQAAEQLLGRNKLFLARNDINLFIGGRVRQEGFYFDKPLTFRNDYNDEYGFFRAKYNFDIAAQYGARTFGDTPVEGAARITVFNAWNNFDVYTPVVGEPVAFSPQNFIKKEGILCTCPHKS